MRARLCRFYNRRFICRRLRSRLCRKISRAALSGRAADEPGCQSLIGPFRGLDVDDQAKDTVEENTENKGDSGAQPQDSLAEMKAGEDQAKDSDATAKADGEQAKDSIEKSAEKTGKAKSHKRDLSELSI